MCSTGTRVLQVLDVKIFDPIGSRLQDTGERGAYVACGNTHEAAVDVHRRDRHLAAVRCG